MSTLKTLQSPGLGATGALADDSFLLIAGIALLVVVMVRQVMIVYENVSLTREQRTAIISAIRTNASDRGVLERTPDDLLLAALHALTGRTGDLIRHVTAAARYSNL